MNLTKGQEAALLALYDRGGSITYVDALATGRADKPRWTMPSMWALVRGRGLAVYYLHGKRFELTPRGRLIGRLLRKEHL